MVKNAFQGLRVEQQNRIYCKSQAKNLRNVINQDFRLIYILVLCWCRVARSAFQGLRVEQQSKWWSSKIRKT